VWNDGLTKETSKVIANLADRLSNNLERSTKISNALTGVPKSVEHRRKIGLNTIKWLRTHQIDKPSALELMFAEELDRHNIPYECQVVVGYHLFDFKIVGTRILIEVDGDFFHCNSAAGFSVKYPVQQKTLINDAKKTNIANRLGYTLIRIWESDFRANPKEQIHRILSEMSKR
jgi:very-short-patch-repair endonuclease